jgi:hypothetical protein
MFRTAQVIAGLAGAFGGVRSGDARPTLAAKCVGAKVRAADKNIGAPLTPVDPA